MSICSFPKILTCMGFLNFSKFLFKRKIIIVLVLNSDPVARKTFVGRVLVFISGIKKTLSPK